MNKSESKYFNTAVLMDNALVSLLEKKDFEYITIKEICETAGVNRSTFYLHYDNVTDLLTECIDYFAGSFYDSFGVTHNEFVSDINSAPLDKLIFIKSEFLTPYLTFIAEHKSFYKAVFKNPVAMQAYKQLDNLSKNVLFPVLNRFNVPQDEQSYMIAFYVRGITAIVSEWVSDNCDKTIEEIEKIIQKCIRPYFENNDGSL